MSKEMMICPKAKECEVLRCVHDVPHERVFYMGRDICFGGANSSCPACIPYIPEQPKKPTCPECGCLVSEHKEFGCTHEFDEYLTYGKFGKRYCTCKLTPADLQPAEPELTLKTLQEACSKMLVVDDSPYSEPAEMPLIEHCPRGYLIICADCDVSKLTDEQIVDTKSPCWKQAHDSAVASKARREFAENVIATMPYLQWTGDPIERILADECIAHIRAMAGKE